MINFNVNKARSQYNFLTNLPDDKCLPGWVRSHHFKAKNPKSIDKGEIVGALEKLSKAFGCYFVMTGDFSKHGKKANEISISIGSVNNDQARALFRNVSALIYEA